MVFTSDNVRGLRPSRTSLADRVCAPLEGHPQDSILDRYIFVGVVVVFVLCFIYKRNLPSIVLVLYRVCSPLEGHPQDSILDRYVRTFFTDVVVVLSTKDRHRVLYLFCITCLLCRWGDLLGHGGEGDVLGRVPEHQQLWPGEH